MAAGGALALAVAFARLSRYRVISLPAYIYTELFRTTPILVQIVWVFYVLPIIAGITLSPFGSGLLALSLNVGAFVGEIFRAGLLSVPPTQRDAAFALGMTGFQANRRVIVPQAAVRIIPPLATIWVSLFKDTSIVSAIGVAELMYRARSIAVQT